MPGPDVGAVVAAGGVASAVALEVCVAAAGAGWDCPTGPTGTVGGGLMQVFAGVWLAAIGLAGAGPESQFDLV